MAQILLEDVYRQIHASVQKGPSSPLNLLPTFCAIKREPHPYFISQLLPDGGGTPAPASQRHDLGGDHGWRLRRPVDPVPRVLGLGLDNF